MDGWGMDEWVWDGDNEYIDGWRDGQMGIGGRTNGGWIDRLNSFVVVSVCPITPLCLVGPKINGTLPRATERQEPFNSKGPPSAKQGK